MGSINWAQYIKAAEDAGESLQEFTPIPAGTYEVSILDAKVKPTKKGDKDMFVITFVVEGGPHAGRRLFTNIVLSPESPKAMAIAIRQLTALGVRHIMDAGGSLEQVAAGLKGALATVKVSVGEYGGKPKNEVDSIAGRQGGQAGPNPAAFAGPQGLPI